MNYKTKLVFVALLPIILISFATIFVVNIQYNRLATSQSEIVEKMYLDLKKNELQNYIELAEGAVAPMYTSTLKTKRQAQREASDILRKMSYGQDNYFFVYDEGGTNIVNPRLTYFVGNNWLGLENSDGKHIIRDMIKIGQDGGGFYEHTWLKPSTGEYVDKLAYSTYFSKWGWMLGTGIYLDDVTEKVNIVQTEMSNSIKQTRFVLLLLSVGAISVTTIILAGLQFSEQRLADAKLKSLTARIVEIQEDERKRVSRELHDSISQLLVSARYGIENALSNTRRGSKVIKPINTSMKALDAAINEVRRISMDLRPSVLDDMGLAAAVKGLGADFSQHNMFDVKVDAQPVHNLLSDEVKTALYRVVQEALTNCAKHSDASLVSIKLSKTKTRVQLSIKDNGRGADYNERSAHVTSGLGLRNMQERIDSFNGQIKFADAKPHGFTVSVTIPIEKDATKGSF
ncbi:cache domain-containing protein [Amylibacter sp. SFDW26]|uniref:cache domain-containing protein n=1 Tax=Amylibacter sp. SFDW26 TaxID=2652722 RepID=UPI001869C0AF|nr:cache domain-containing protein [Amylibacter sp. SFDW26]